MNEQWEELKETIIELRDNDGTGTQQEVCGFLANLMDVLEKQVQKPCEDVMSRQAVTKILEQTGWIPVSERLPEEDEIVLLTICANSALYGFNENFIKVMCGSYSPYEDKRDWIVNEVRYYIDNVIAWMPLPKPYEKG